MSPSSFVADPVASLVPLLREFPALAAALRPLPLWAHGLLLAGALLVLAAGARWRRPVALPGGAAAGWLAGMAVAGLLELPGRTVPLVAAALVGGASLLAPSVFPFAFAALPGAFLGARIDLPGGPAVGAGIGILLLGGLGLLAARTVAAAVAGLAGGALAGLVLLAASRHLPVLSILGKPVLLAGLVLVLAISGAAFQMGAAWGTRKAGPPRKATAAPGAEPQHA